MYLKKTLLFVLCGVLFIIFHSIRISLHSVHCSVLYLCDLTKILFFFISVQFK